MARLPESALGLIEISAIEHDMTPSVSRREDTALRWDRVEHRLRRLVTGDNGATMESDPAPMLLRWISHGRQSGDLRQLGEELKSLTLPLRAR